MARHADIGRSREGTRHRTLPRNRQRLWLHDRHIGYVCDPRGVPRHPHTTMLLATLAARLLQDSPADPVPPILQHDSFSLRMVLDKFVSVICHGLYNAPVLN